MTDDDLTWPEAARADMRCCEADLVALARSDDPIRARAAAAILWTWHRRVVFRLVWRRLGAQAERRRVEREVDRAFLEAMRSFNARHHGSSQPFLLHWSRQAIHRTTGRMCRED